MAYKTEATNKLIKFVRGTTELFSQITKQEDTLYFIYENDNSTTGILYLGEKQIGNGNITTISDLIAGTFSDGDLLVYDTTSGEWVAEPLETAVRIMSGATAAADGQSGLAPTPHAGDQSKFLRGDGTWATPTAASIIDVDNVTLEVNAQDKVGLKGFQSATVGSIPQKSANGLTWVPLGSISGSGLTYKKVNNLNEVNESSIIYLVPNNGGTNNLFDEYMFIDNQPERIGSVGNVDLTGYVKTTTFNSTVGNLYTALGDKVDQSDFNTLSNTVNEINERLVWQKIVETTE